jgi:hypothetical protein
MGRGERACRTGEVYCAWVRRQVRSKSACRDDVSAEVLAKAEAWQRRMKVNREEAARRSHSEGRGVAWPEANDKNLALAPELRKFACGRYGPAAC